MFEAIVTLVIPPKTELVHGTGALLSRDRVEEVESAYTEVYKFEFDTEEAMWGWLHGNGAEPISFTGLAPSMEP